MSAETTVKNIGTTVAKKTGKLLKKNLKQAGEAVLTKIVNKTKKDAEFKLANFFTARQAGMMAGMHTARGRDFLMSAKPAELAKLGAGIGAVKGSLDYLGGEDKSLGSLIGNVGVNATAGGALGYSGGLVRNYVRTNIPRAQPQRSTTIVTPPSNKAQSQQMKVIDNNETEVASLPSRGTLVRTDSYSNPQNMPNPTYNSNHVFDARNRVGVKTLAGRVRTTGKLVDSNNGRYRLQKAQPRKGATLLESSKNINNIANFGSANYNIANFGVIDMLKRLI